MTPPPHVWQPFPEHFRHLVPICFRRSAAGGGRGGCWWQLISWGCGRAFRSGRRGCRRRRSRRTARSGCGSAPRRPGRGVRRQRLQPAGCGDVRGCRFGRGSPAAAGVARYLPSATPAADSGTPRRNVGFCATSFSSQRSKSCAICRIAASATRSRQPSWLSMRPSWYLLRSTISRQPSSPAPSTVRRLALPHPQVFSPCFSGRRSFRG
ncbi:hypothetical protein EV646_104158 [Kribbella antiqua]|uniref:Uncharacterized protein n=1 Tax=Kribbella antiqua TaxID=2512217 RepID=A0A4R2IS75_9ACTN|nr:hypothetical protein EV646_104158 [Kribbella antiqua]